MQFTGRVTADAEVKTVKSDRTVTNFTVVLNKRWKDKEGNMQEKSAFIDCAYWINSGVGEFLKKGTIVEISGWMDVRAWTNKDGEAKANLTCTVDTIRLFGGAETKGGKAAKGSTSKPDARKPENVTSLVEEDDLPF